MPKDPQRGGWYTQFDRDTAHAATSLHGGYLSQMNPILFNRLLCSAVVLCRCLITH